MLGYDWSAASCLCQLAAGTRQLFVNVVSEYVSWEALHLAKIVVSEQSS